MKTSLMKKIVFLTVACLLSVGLPLQAQEGTPVERVTATQGKTVVIRAGEQVLLEKEITFAGGIKVMTNALFKVNEGKERPLKEGQILSADGTILNPDGSITPAVDHVAMKSGRATLVKDGEPAVLDAEMTLADGTRIMPDGTITSRDGSRRKLLDGQLFKLEGGEIPAQDTILLKDGKVFVQKDGSTLPVAPGRTIMMNDGTKVFGDGTVIMKDGNRITLAEGQLLTVEGVVRRK